MEVLLRCSIADQFMASMGGVEMLRLLAAITGRIGNWLMALQRRPRTKGDQLTWYLVSSLALMPLSSMATRG
jgi:hypothetical protein